MHHYFVAMRDFVTNWWPLLGLTFYGLLIYIFWRMLQLMPRVKPAEVDTTSKQAVTRSDVAGVTPTLDVRGSANCWGCCCCCVG